MRSSKGIILIIFTVILFVCCKKTKLDGKFSKLVGTWSWAYTIDGLSGVHSTSVTAGYSMRLELKERGKYKLYSNNKKIEDGRLIEDNGFIKFVGDDIIRKKDDRLRDSKILNSDDDTIVTGSGSCCDTQTMTFSKN